MKIIHIVLGKANPNRMNGVNKAVHQLTQAQFGIGHQVEIWGITKDPNSPSIVRDCPIRLFSDPQFLFAFDSRITSQLKKERGPLMVHFHGGFVPAFAGIARTLRKLKIPYCLTGHGAYNKIAMEKSRNKKRIYFSLVEKKLLKNAHAVHCIGRSEVEALNSILPSARAALIPNGHNIPRTTPRPSRSNPGPLSFGFCGRLRAHTKGLDILFKAFADFQKDNSSTLVIIGDGPDRKDLESLAVQLGIGGKVQFMGPRYGKEKDALLSRIDVFLHPSRNEGMPGAVLEAAGLSIPVIVSKATNLAEAVTSSGAGLTLPQNDPQNLVSAFEKVKEARSNGDIKQWAINAHTMVAKQFSWNRIAKLHFKMYNYEA